VLWRLALRLSGGNTTAAEDIEQDAWLRAVERLPQFRWESSLKTWLCGFVVNRCREYWKNDRTDNRRWLRVSKKRHRWSKFSNFDLLFRAFLTRVLQLCQVFPNPSLKKKTQLLVSVFN
jgi:DNA-directed RNA polymerase specialized sigma24 family protein